MKRQSKARVFITKAFILSVFIFTFVKRNIETLECKELSTEIVEQKSAIEESKTALKKKILYTPRLTPEELINNYFISCINEEYEAEVKEPINPYQELIDNLTEDERYLIYQITHLEAGTQSLNGQRAVIEVIFNRVLSPSFPNTVIEVLSQKGQFVTWEKRYSEAHSNEQVDALELVYNEEPILTLDYYMFSRNPFSWADNYIQIEDHWFGTFKK